MRLIPVGVGVLTKNALFIPKLMLHVGPTNPVGQSHGFQLPGREQTPPF